MNNKYTFALLSFAIAAAFAISVSAQSRPPVPMASSKASVMQRVGTTDISITYSRPGVKGRTIWGDPPPGTPAGEATLDDGRQRPAGSPIVFYGKLWRAGANEATLFTVNDDVMVNGQPLAAGKYSLHMIPGKEEWTIIFNKDDGQWGSFSYDAKKDALRVKTKATWVAESKEQLYYGIDNITDNSGTVYLRWEKVKVPFTVEVKDVVGTTMARLAAYVGAAKSDDPAPALAAANYARNNKQADAATKWFEMALKASDEQVKARANYANLNRRVNILAALGKTQDAIATAEQAIAAGKTEKVDTAALEKRLADWKAGKTN